MRPYLVINHLGRSKIDVNRPIKEGVEDPMTLVVWLLGMIIVILCRSLLDVETNFGHGLLMTLHSWSSLSGTYFEIGCVLLAETLSFPTSQINEKS
ncbi:t9ss c-terminal target domain-containing protein [Gigaspora margarita]|uniref:T9ss c-terminal target domain-containing protein n=1 Tax=Gigaspora margarita TaxID=4874 RepID=A0A8H3X0G3_GIGMA|nr:t9ss c-terminal target domain-containing protein [Gigaspora margarita]